MWRSRLFWKLYAGYASFVLVAAVVAGLSISRPVAIGIVLGASLLAGFVLVRRVVLLVDESTSALGAMSQGEYDRRFTPGAGSESDAVGQAFNQAAAAIRQHIDDLRSENAELSSILGGMVEGVVVIDTAERVVYINRVATEMLDVPPRDNLARPIWEVTRLPQVTELLRAILESASPLNVETHIVDQPRDRFIDLYGSPLRGPDGQLSGAIVVLHDVSELRRLEQVRRDFVANVSHELKTPITAIQGMVETLLETQDTEAEMHRHFLTRIKHQSERMAALTVDLLSLSRLESDNTPLDQEPIDWRAVVGESIQSFGAAAEQKGVAVSFTSPQPCVDVLGDREALRQVVNNLLDNALKYTEPGGRITLTIVEGESDAVLTVSDTGCGISRADQERVFERFYRVDKARSREMGGTGLGLAIVKHMVRSLNGSVSVSSTLGEGSTFRVSLPLARSGAPPRTGG